MVRVVAQHAREALVELLTGEAFGFARVVKALQKVDLGDSPPRRCNRVRPESVFFGVVTVSGPVSIHLKEFDVCELRGLQLVVHMELGAES